jgi:hypothetical protein
MSEASGNIGERAAASVGGENQALRQYNTRQDDSYAKLAHEAGNRNGKNAGNKEGPNRRVEQLHGDQLAGLTCFLLHRSVD